MRFLALGFGLLSLLMTGMVLLAADPDGKPVEFVTLAKQFDGGPKAADEKVIQGPMQWQEFLDSLTSKDLREPLAAQKIDFEKQTVIAISLGPFDSSLQPHEKKMAGVQQVLDLGGKAMVKYKVVESDERLPVATLPVQVIRIPKVESALFERSTGGLGG